ncbi:hypothetical protein DFS33DRAFT_1273625 [Desarmillaria ectypa]|nr:hypothetical protein DFS33DRAFT_1273625 [Desarmillaria ectypa]
MQHDLVLSAHQFYLKPTQRSQDSGSSGNVDARRPSTRILFSSGPKSFLRRLSDALTSSPTDPSSDPPSALAQQRREEALRERGLLPPLTATNPSNSPPPLEWDATALFEEVRLASDKASSQQGPTAAELVKKQWEQSKNEAGPSILRPSRFIEHIPVQDDLPPGNRTSPPDVSIPRSNTRRPSTSSSSTSPRKPRPLGPRNRSDTRSSSSSFPPPLPKGASPPVAFVTRSALPNTPAHPTSVSQRSRKKDLSPIDVDWERQASNPVADPVPCTRKPIQVTIHNRTSLTIEARQIADIESRRVAEMAFLDPFITHQHNAATNANDYLDLAGFYWLFRTHDTEFTTVAARGGVISYVIDSGYYSAVMASRTTHTGWSSYNSASGQTCIREALQPSAAKMAENRRFFNHLQPLQQVLPLGLSGPNSQRPVLVYLALFANGARLSWVKINDSTGGEFAGLRDANDSILHLSSPGQHPQFYQECDHHRRRREDASFRILYEIPQYEDY